MATGSPPDTKPAGIVSKINTDLRRGLATPKVAARIESVGNEVVGTSTEDAVRLLRDDAEKWAKLVRERNIRFQKHRARRASHQRYLLGRRMVRHMWATGLPS